MKNYSNITLCHDRVVPGIGGTTMERLEKETLMLLCAVRTKVGGGDGSKQ